MRVPFIAGNWKMNTTASEAKALVEHLKGLLRDMEDVDVAVCPPFPYLVLISALIKGSRILLGAQNMFWESKGAYTGEVSPEMLKDVGCTYVILGHSERRHVLGETDLVINSKIRRALDSHIAPIVCVGETLDEREAGKTESVVENQLGACLDGFAGAELKQLAIAYEPVWAIGTGKTATPQQAQEVHQFVREWVGRRFGNELANNLRIQYGGSVKPDNAQMLMVQPDIDGALVGGASLKAESFAAIVRAAVSF